MKLFMIAGTIAATLFSGAVFAATNEPTTQQRKEMASLHEKMAACLRSDKTMTECRTEMQKQCQTAKDKNACSMAGMGRMGPMMGGQMDPHRGHKGMKPRRAG
ncbi:MAG: hypothetical protein A2X94_13880 [Bdellovibrionales bacterium GWB1_55_8]|nr:MAG: hypothetical protein A2X94_13880 [Bdellovibrionales bacterium GWB1_55_8]